MFLRHTAAAAIYYFPFISIDIFLCVMFDDFCVCFHFYRFTCCLMELNVDICWTHRDFSTFDSHSCWMNEWAKEMEIMRKRESETEMKSMKEKEKKLSETVKSKCVSEYLPMLLCGGATGKNKTASEKILFNRLLPPLSLLLFHTDPIRILYLCSWILVFFFIGNSNDFLEFDFFLHFLLTNIFFSLFLL